MRKILIIFLLLVIVNGLFAQLKRANEYFNLKQYENAIVYYQKVLKKHENNKEALQNIAFAYRKIKDYENAEKYFAKAVEINPDESSNNLYYGQALKNNNKVLEARNQFIKYVDKNPASVFGKLLVQSCSDISEWDQKEKAYQVKLVENINSKGSDFCPLIYKDGIIFVSDRDPDLVNGNTFSYANQPYLSIFYAEKDKQYKKAKKFSNQLTSLYHDGPVSITEDGKTIYFTKVDKKEQGKNFVNRLKIYSATLEGKKWKNITPFQYNSKDYSVAHPWISADGKKLFFASDMTGGFGGMDLYMCNKTSDGWSKPINLGSEVNTKENEVFPYYRNGVLYFSSDGLAGYGGLDIFSVKEKDNWKNPVNLKAPLNSSKDDFGIFYNDDENGFFSSDREGGIGSDDIYSFNWHTLIPQTTMSGLLQLNKIGMDGTKISLLDENDNVVQTLTTDSLGRFKFDKLDLDKNYTLRLDATDDGVMQNADLYLTNSKGQKVLVANKIGKGKFTFKALPYSSYDKLEIIKEVDESLFTVSVFGQVYKKLPGDYSGGMDILIVNDDGKIIGKATTDKNGKFRFDKLSPDEEYLFKLSEDDSEFKMVITDENGKVLEAAKRLIDGKYKYVRLSADKNVLTLINEVDEVIKIAENENFIISKILYDYRSDKINNEAAKELDKLVLILKKNKNIGVELSSHTDSKGGDAYNLELSQRRADKAVEYIVSQGIDRDRITAKGYGETRPVAPNNLPNGKDNPEGRAKNRRTEFKVIKLK